MHSFRKKASLLIFHFHIIDATLNSGTKRKPPLLTLRAVPAFHGLASVMSFPVWQQSIEIAFGNVCMQAQH